MNLFARHVIPIILMLSVSVLAYIINIPLLGAFSATIYMLYLADVERQKNKAKRREERIAAHKPMQYAEFEFCDQTGTPIPHLPVNIIAWNRHNSQAAQAGQTSTQTDPRGKAFLSYTHGTEAEVFIHGANFPATYNIQNEITVVLQKSADEYQFAGK